MGKESGRFEGVGGLQKFLLWAVFSSAFIVAYLPVLSGLIHSWANSDDNSHGFAIVPIAIYILWQKRETLLNQAFKGEWSGFVVAAIAVVIYLISLKGEIQTLGSFSMIIFVWGTVVFLFGFSIFKTSLFPLTILFFMIPVPAQIVAAFTIPLKLIVTKASVWLASTAGIPIFNEGNVISMTRCTFEVVQACSGLRSIMTLLTLGAVLAYVTLRSNLLRTLLFLLAVPIAIAINILRVFVMIAVFHLFEINLSTGALHTILGFVVFALALGLFVIAGKGLALCES
ncbi:MAG: exosortase [bacterium]|nr:exosortase [bacterium]